MPKQIDERKILRRAQDAFYAAEVVLWPFRDHPIVGSLRARLTALRHEAEKALEKFETEAYADAQAVDDVEPKIL